MSVQEFMKKNIDVIKNDVIKAIPNDTFDSHEFIRKFAKRFELHYVTFLNSASEEPFRKVHAEIGRFLSVNKESLNLKDDGVTESPNVFGNVTPNERWVKTA
jgi:hypothetical protein